MKLVITAEIEFEGKIGYLKKDQKTLVEEAENLKDIILDGLGYPDYLSIKVNVLSATREYYDEVLSMGE